MLNTGNELVTSKLSGNNLYKGVSMLYDMEKNNYLITRAIMRLNYEIPRLGNATKISKPYCEKAEAEFEYFFSLSYIGAF